jgi:hypothetical protein
LPKAVVGLAVLVLGVVPATATAARPKAPSKAKAQRYLSKAVKDPQGQAILEKVIACTRPRKHSRAARCSVVIKLEGGRTCSDNTVNVRYRARKGSRLRVSGLNLVCVSPPPPPAPVTPAAPDAPAVDPNLQPDVTVDQLPPIVQPPGPHGGPPPPPPGDSGKVVAHQSAAVFDSCTNWEQGAWLYWPYLWTYSCFYIYDANVFGTRPVEEDVYFWNPNDGLSYYWFYWYPVL